MVSHSCILRFMRVALLDTFGENRVASCPQSPEELLRLLESAVRQVRLEGSSIGDQGPLTLVLFHVNRCLPHQRFQPAYPLGNPILRLDQQPKKPSHRYETVQDTFLLPFVHGFCTARVQWQFHGALFRVLAWQSLVKLSGGLLSWGT